MVRPVGSVRNKHLGLTFACVMTVEDKGFSIARQGRDSIYDVFGFCYPSAVRENKRNGISQIELNKALEALSFERLRFRKKSKKAKTDLSDSLQEKCPLGSYRFGDRRWCDPDNKDEFPIVLKAWETLSEIAKPECSFQSWLAKLRAAIASNNAFMKSYEQRGTTEWVAPAIEVEREPIESETEEQAELESQPSSSGTSAAQIGAKRKAAELEEGAKAVSSSIPSLLQSVGLQNQLAAAAAAARGSTTTSSALLPGLANPQANLLLQVAQMSSLLQAQQTQLGVAQAASSIAAPLHLPAQAPGFTGLASALKLPVQPTLLNPSVVQVPSPLAAAPAQPLQSALAQASVPALQAALAPAQTASSMPNLSDVLSRIIHKV